MLPLETLLAELSDRWPGLCAIGGWTVEPVAGGTNGRVYRLAAGEREPLMVKFSLADPVRRRAWREAASMRLLAGTGLAPELVLLDEASYRHPVVVATWLDGEALPSPPRTDPAWRDLVLHYAAIHRVEAGDAQPVGSPHFDPRSNSLLAGELVAVPAAEVPHSLLECLAAAQAVLDEVRSEHVSLAYSRCDPNPANLLSRRDVAWASVDWENAGLGDPAYELADMRWHPAYLDIDDDRWAWVRRFYAAQMGNRDLEDRIRRLEAVLPAWWWGRLVRMRWERQHGLDQRLVPTAWEPRHDALMERYRSAALREPRA